MPRHVLVPLDGSDKDERALGAASALAELTGAAIHLVRVLDTPIAELSPRTRTMGGLDDALQRRLEMQRTSMLPPVAPAPRDACA